MDTVETGRCGEAKIVAHLVVNGYEVYSPLFGNTSCDLIVLKDSKIYRVECKTTAFTRESGRYEVQLRSVRHNKTKNTVHKFDASKSDLLAIYIAPEDRVIILNSIDYDGRSTVSFEPGE
ncbi:MAG: hypothetical protein LC723_14490 [Actinobacteria bacterium]|nr:hypothetical protein [Actinomycetota bacterium]